MTNLPATTVELTEAEIDEVDGGLMLQAFGYFVSVSRLSNGEIMYGYGKAQGVGHWGTL